jgi:hypothetical protein
MPEPKAKLNPDTVAQFVGKLQQDPSLKGKAIAHIHRLGFRSFVNEHFSADDRQRGELDLLQDRDIEEIFGRAVIVSLERNSPIKIIHEGHSPPNLRMEIWYEKGKGAGVSIHC